MSVAVALICLATAWEQPDTFATKANFFNVTRNFAGIGIMAMGMTAVIITGGIDLSVGSVMAFVAIVAARLLEAEYPWFVAYAAGLGVGAMVGAVNGSLIAYVKLPPFVVTLGMLSIARSLAIVVSENRVIYQFGPGGDVFKAIGGGQIELPWIDGGTLQLSNLFVVLVVLAIVTATGAQDHRLGALHPRDRRQRERRAPDRHPGRSDQDPGLRVLQPDRGASRR